MAFAEAKTAMGIIGIKVWIYKGEIMEHDPMAQERRMLDSGEQRARSGRQAA
jgi:small subunit ribosomal protein S3